MSTKHLPSHHRDREACRQYLEAISAYVDGALEDELCRELEAHMATCDNCRVVVNTVAKTISLYHQMPAPEMPSHVRERLYRVLNLEDYLAPRPEAGEQH